MTVDSIATHRGFKGFEFSYAPDFSIFLAHVFIENLVSIVQFGNGFIPATVVGVGGCQSHHRTAQAHFVHHRYQPRPNPRAGF